MLAGCVMNVLNRKNVSSSEGGKYGVIETVFFLELEQLYHSRFRTDLRLQPFKESMVINLLLFKTPNIRGEIPFSHRLHREKESGTCRHANCYPYTLYHISYPINRSIAIRPACSRRMRAGRRPLRGSPTDTF